MNPKPANAVTIPAELAQQAQRMQQRAVDNFGEWADGLAHLVAAAQGGNPQARQLLRTVRGLLRQAEFAESGLVIPTGNGGPAPAA
jgi:hypothetical protein